MAKDRNVTMLDALYNENNTVGKCLAEIADRTICPVNVPMQIKQVIEDAGIDSFVFKSMVDDIYKGNFAVIYIDDRLVAGDKKRQKAQQTLSKIRSYLFKLKAEGWSTFQILFQAR